MSMKSLWVLVIFMAIFGGGLLFANLNRSKEDLIEEAQIFGYPLALMDATKEVMTKASHPTSRKAPLNQFAHLRELPNPDFKDILSPNADTLYSIAWQDLSKEPLILKVPKIPIVDRPFSDREDLKFNEDGSLDILIQKEKPKDTFNWLPLNYADL